MKKLRAGAVVAVIAAMQAVALVVSMPAQAAYAPPISPDAPPRVTAPPPTTFKPPTTALTPQSILKRTPIGIAFTLDEFLTPWLRSITGNTSNPSLGCVVDGKFIKASGSGECAAPAPTTQQQTPGPDGLVVPDLLWNALTGKNLNPLLLGPAPPNTSNIQIIPNISAGPAPNKIIVSWTGAIGQTCITYPQFNECKGDQLQSAMGGAQNLAPMFVQCKTANGGIVGPWNGTTNGPKGTSTSQPGHTKAGTTFTVCGPDQMTEYAKIKAKAAPVDGQNGSTFTPSVAPGVWINPQKDIWQDTTITNTLTCKNGSGGSVTVSGTSTGTGIVKQLQCPAGYLPDSGSTSIGNAFLDAPEKVEEWSILPETRETYPDCIGWQSAGCIMRVELDGVDCSPGNPACFDWAEIFRLQPSRVKCKWGNYTLDMSNCLPLRNGYQSESGISSVPNQVPGAAPLSRDVFGNPVQPNADPAAPPMWQPNFDPTVPGVDPDGPGPLTAPTAPPVAQPVPTTGTNPPTVPNPSGNTQNNCLNAMWTWNPVDWVMVPVQCALTWAFVPNAPAAQAKGEQIKTELENKGIVAPIAALTAALDTLPTGGGCSGPTIVFELRSVHQEMQPFNACSEPMASVAMAANALGSVYLVLFGSVSFIRAISNAFGYNFSMGGKTE